MYLATGVAEDYRLGDGQRIVQIAKGAQFPVLLLHVDVKLLDTLKGQFLLLNQDADGITHEATAHFEHIRRHGGGQQDDLHIWGQHLEDILDLILETAGQHLIGLIQHEQLDVLGAQHLAVDHVVDAARSAHHHMATGFQDAGVFAHVSAANAGVRVHLHVLAERHHHALDLRGQLASGGQDQRLALANARVDLLKDSNREGGSLASSYGGD